MQNQGTIEEILETISRISPPILSRSKIEEITGGVIKAKTLANIDSDPDSDSIKPRLKLGNKVCYSKEAVIEYLKRRCELV